MKKLVIGLAVVLALAGVVVLGQSILDVLGTNDTAVTVDETDQNVKETKLPASKNSLEQEDAVKIRTVKRVVILQAKNTVVLRGPITGDAVGKLITEINRISRNLSNKESIYLVLDTPGGSVSDGADLIDFLEGLPQKVTTVTIFSASMGFQIVENNTGDRLITRNGILMSHRAAMEGLGGQFDGELESRYKMFKRQLDYLENVDANRLGLSLPEYRARIKDELWIHGFDAVDYRAADAEVLVQCGSSIKGTDEIKVQTMFGPVTVVFDKCPLVRQPIAIQLDNVQPNARNYVSSIMRDLFYNQRAFVRKFVETNKFYDIFPQH